MPQSTVQSVTEVPAENGNGTVTNHGAAALAAWDQRWRDEYGLHRTHHAFLLHGNVLDYTYGDMDLRTHLRRSLAKKELVVIYNRAEGLVIPDEGQQRKFMEITGLLAGATESDLAAAAELGMGGPGGPQGPSFGDIPNEPGVCLPLIDRLLRQRAVRVAVILDYADSLAPSANMAQMTAEDRTNQILLQRWAQDPEVAANSHPIFLIAATLGDISLSIRTASSQVSVIEIPMPDHAARLEFIQALARANNNRRESERWRMAITATEFARLTAGLPRRSIGEIVKAAIGSNRPVDAALVQDQKRKIIKAEFEDVIEPMEPAAGFDSIGGLEHVKHFLRYSVIEPMRSGEWEDCPMGVLFLGAAGTGKTVMANACAFEAGVSAVRYNLARIFGKFVGDSERNQEKAFKCIEAMSPCIVFIDEIDQKGQRGGENDGGTATRVFGRLLEWLAEPSHRGKIVVLAASNRPAMIDPALKRPGRFDRKVPFLAPDEEERRQIATVHLSRYVRTVTDAGAGQFEEAAALVGARTEGWTGAEIEDLARKVRELLKQKRAASVVASVDMALGLLLPSTAAVQQMTMEAIRELNDLDLLPERIRPLALRLRQQEHARQQRATAGEVPAVPEGEGDRSL